MSLSNEVALGWREQEPEGGARLGGQRWRQFISPPRCCSTCWINTIKAFDFKSVRQHNILKRAEALESDTLEFSSWQYRLLAVSSQWLPKSLDLIFPHLWNNTSHTAVLWRLKTVNSPFWDSFSHAVVTLYSVNLVLLILLFANSPNKTKIASILGYLL